MPLVGPKGEKAGFNPSKIKDFIDEGLALVITTWLDLGSELTPMNTSWRVHLAGDKAAEISASGEAVDVRLLFESEPGL